jgi:hypothetical protein
VEAGGEPTGDQTVQVIPRSVDSDQLPLRRLRISAWLIFGVALAWVPLIIDVLAGSEVSDHVGFFQALSHGELVLVSAFIAAGALGELIIAIAQDGRTHVLRKMVLAGLLIIEFAVTAMYYAVLRFQGDPVLSQEGRIADFSLTFFGATLVTSFSAMLFIEGGD